MNQDGDQRTLSVELITKIKLVEEVFNQLFKIYHITYGEFNKRFPVEGFKCDEQALLSLEKKHYELGLAGKDTKDFGVSVISLMATITDIFTGGYRFSVSLQSMSDNSKLTKGNFEDRRIEGVELAYYPPPRKLKKVVDKGK
jgi:hypothetical protein